MARLGFSEHRPELLGVGGLCDAGVQLAPGATICVVWSHKNSPTVARASHSTTAGRAARTFTLRTSGGGLPAGAANMNQLLTISG